MFFVLSIEGGIVGVAAFFRRLHGWDAFMNQGLRVDNFLAVNVLRGADAKRLFEGVGNPRLAQIELLRQIGNRQGGGKVFVYV